MQLKYLIVILLFTLSNSILYAEAILNIDQPIRTLKVTNEQLKAAIVNAAQEQNWLVISEGDGQMSAVYRQSDYMARINIKYTPGFYTINYADSTRMHYRGNSIHPTYNTLIKELQANIVRNLKSGNFEVPAIAQTVTLAKTEIRESTATVQQQEDIRSKLVKLKQLYVDDLITEDEYNAKRKSLIETY